jgi:hypothetical protein
MTWLTLSHTSPHMLVLHWHLPLLAAVSIHRSFLGCYSVIQQQPMSRVCRRSLRRLLPLLYAANVLSRAQASVLPLAADVYLLGDCSSGNYTNLSIGVFTVLWPVHLRVADSTFRRDDLRSRLRSSLYKCLAGTLARYAGPISSQKCCVYHLQVPYTPPPHTSAAARRPGTHRT